MILRNESDLLASLENAGKIRPVVWLFGSGLTCPRTKDQTTYGGVPSVRGMLERAKKVFYEEGAKDRYDRIASMVDQSDNAQAVSVIYKQCFTAMDHDFGRRMIAKFIREAVLEAYQAPLDNFIKRRIAEGDLSACEDVQRNHANWALRPGLRDLGRLIVESPNVFGQTVLTTNFDPVIEVSIRNANGRPTTVVVPDDYVLSRCQTDEPLIVHLHGYWSDSLFLNTDRELETDREKLKRSLQYLFDNTHHVYVLGYGGWVDIVTKVLTSYAHFDSGPTIHWCFREPDTQRVQADNAGWLKSFETAIVADRFRTYCGIDVDSLFPQMLDRICGARSKEAEASQSDADSITARLGRWRFLDALIEEETALNLTLRSKAKEASETKELFQKEASELAHLRSENQSLNNELRAFVSGMRELQETISHLQQRLEGLDKKVNETDQTLSAQLITIRNHVLNPQRVKYFADRMDRIESAARLSTSIGVKAGRLVTRALLWGSLFVSGSVIMILVGTVIIDTPSARPVAAAGIPTQSNQGSVLWILLCLVIFGSIFSLLWYWSKQETQQLQNHLARASDAPVDVPPPLDDGSPENPAASTESRQEFN